MFVTVTKSYASQYPDPISFEARVTVHVERADTEYPDWFWCRALSGKEGWVHRSFLAACSGPTTSLQAYSAKELTAAAGDRGTLIQLLDGWAYLRLERGDEGWIPQSHLHFPEA